MRPRSGTREGLRRRARRRPLPKVGKWTAWNEPNLAFWLRPLSYKPRRHLQALAGAYARICNAVRVGVHEAGAEALSRTRSSPAA